MKAIGIKTCRILSSEIVLYTLGDIKLNSSVINQFQWYKVSIKMCDNSVFNNLVIYQAKRSNDFFSV